MGLPTRGKGNGGCGGPDRRGGDDGNRRPASVKASLSVAFGQRAPNRAGTKDSARLRGAEAAITGRERDGGGSHHSRSRSRSLSREVRRNGNRHRTPERHQQRDRDREPAAERDRPREYDDRCVGSVWNAAAVHPGNSTHHANAAAVWQPAGCRPTFCMFVHDGNVGGVYALTNLLLQIRPLSTGSCVVYTCELVCEFSGYSNILLACVSSTGGVMTESEGGTTEVLTLMGTGTETEVVVMTAGVTEQGMTAGTVTGPTAAGTEIVALTETGRGQIGLIGTSAAEVAAEARAAVGQRVAMQEMFSRNEQVVTVQLRLTLRAVMVMQAASLSLVLVVAAAGGLLMRCSGLGAGGTRLQQPRAICLSTGCCLP